MFVIIFIDGSPFNRTFPMFPTRILPWPPALWHRRPWMPQLGFNMVPSWACENGIAYGIICNIIDLYIYFLFFFGFDCPLWNFYFGDPLNLLICFFRPFVSWLQRSILNQFCFVSVATPLRPLTGHRSDGSSTIGDCKWWALGCFCWDGAMAPHSPQRIDDSGRSTLWWTNIAMENHHFSWENPL